MEVTEHYQNGVEVFKNNPIVAVPIIGAGVLSAVIALIFIGSAAAGVSMMAMSGGTPGIGSVGAIMGTVFVVAILSGIINLVAYGMTVVMADAAMAAKADLNDGLQKTIENIVDLLIAAVLVGAIVMIGMILLVIPGLIAMYLLMFTLPFVMLENKSPVSALQESFELVKANVSSTLVFAVIAFVVMMIAGIIGNLLGPLSFIVSGVAMAYISIVLVMLFKDLRK